MNFRRPRRTGVTLITILCGLTLGALALPMGQAPEQSTGAGGTSPSGPAPGVNAAPAAPENAARSQTLVQDGKLLFEMGKMPEAEKKLTEALRYDIRNQAAYYYLHLIKEQRAQQRGLRNASPARQQLTHKLDDLHLSKVVFDNVPLDQAIRTLSALVTQNDSAGTGVNFVLSRTPPGIDEVTVRIVPQLINVRLGDVLDALVKVASKPIKYAIEDYGIILSLKDTNEAPPLYTRALKVDSSSLENALCSELGKLEAGTQPNPQKLLRNFLTSLHVDLEPPKSVFWNVKQGAIFVRASLQDLDTIESAIMALNLTPPQLHIKARFIKLPKAVASAFWSSQPAATTNVATRSVQMSWDEAQRVLNEWRNNGGADLLTESSVTTLSGRQTEVQIADIANVGVFTNAPEAHWVTNQVTLGPVLNVTPTLSTDWFRTDLAMQAWLKEFVGYSEPADGSPPAPLFREWHLPVTTSVWDGQTLVFGGIFDPPVNLVDPSRDNKMELLIMVTPTAIDPAGNRTHGEEEVEAARKSQGQ